MTAWLPSGGIKERSKVRKETASAGPEDDEDLEEDEEES